MTQSRNNQSHAIGIYVVAFPRVSETFIVTKVLGLLDAGFDVHVFTLTESDEWEKFQILDERVDVKARVHVAPQTYTVLDTLARGVPKFLAMGIRHPFKFTRFVHHCWKHRKTNPAGFVRSLYKRSHIISHNIDLLHVEFDWQAPLVVDMKHFMNCRLLLSSRGTVRRTNVMNNDLNLMGYVFSHADYYHSISRYLVNDLRGLGFPESIPLKIIEPSIDLSLFQNYSWNVKHSDILTIISVARLDWAKGYEFAIDAIALLREAGIAFQYIVIGDGNYEEAIRFAVNQHGLGQSVRFMGSLARNRVVEILCMADIFLHLALEEGFCNAVIEAQAMQIPVIASDAGGLSENVEDGVTGYVVPRRDPKAAADKLIYLARSPDLRAQMGKAGRKRVEEKFNLVHQIEKFSSLYKEILVES